MMKQERNDPRVKKIGNVTWVWDDYAGWGMIDMPLKDQIFGLVGFMNLLLGAYFVFLGSWLAVPPFITFVAIMDAVGNKYPNPNG
jgi:hypothetical protein